MEKKGEKNKSEKAKSDENQGEKCTNLGGSWRSRAMSALSCNYASRWIRLSFVGAARDLHAFSVEHVHVLVPLETLAWSWESHGSCRFSRFREIKTWRGSRNGTIRYASARCLAFSSNWRRSPEMNRKSIVRCHGATWRLRPLVCTEFKLHVLIKSPYIVLFIRNRKNYGIVLIDSVQNMHRETFFRKPSHVLSSDEKRKEKFLK